MINTIDDNIPFITGKWKCHPEYGTLL